jgi:isocitrate lyase
MAVNFKTLTEINKVKDDWAFNPRWENVYRPYTAEEVVSLRGSIREEHTIARLGANKLWDLVNFSAEKGYVNAFGTLTGGMAVQQAKAGMEAIYLSGWQVAADNNTAGTMYPDQSLYPVDSVPALVKSINNALKRADEIDWSNGKMDVDYLLPIIADAEAGFGGVLNAFELMKHMIEAGASAVHWEDQLSSAKKCGHMGGKVLVPTGEAISKLVAARLASDVMDVPTLIIARTDANAASLITSDHDVHDKEFLTGERTSEGFYRVKNGIDQAIARGLAYAPYADLLWCESDKPSIEEATLFADAIHAEYPHMRLAYNCSPSFNWGQHLSEKEIANFQDTLYNLGYVYQFITLAGIHQMWHKTFEFAHAYHQGEGMKHYVDMIQNPEFESREKGYTFAAHQAEVGTGYFDKVANVVNGDNSTGAMAGSTEEEQF